MSPENNSRSQLPIPEQKIQGESWFHETIPAGHKHESHQSSDLLFRQSRIAGRILFYQFIKKVDRFVGDSWVLDAKQLLMAREFGIINRLPSTYSNELKYQSKAMRSSS
jgi:hypothetical protein